MLNHLEAVGFQYIFSWLRLHIQTSEDFVVVVVVVVFFTNLMPLVLSGGPFQVFSIHVHRLRIDQECVGSLGSLWSPL